MKTNKDKSKQQINYPKPKNKSIKKIRTKEKKVLNTEKNLYTILSDYINHIDYIDEIFRNIKDINIINNKHIYIIKSKFNIDCNLLEKRNIWGYGICFFRCISKFLYNITEEKYNLIRIAINTCALYNINEISDFQPNVEIERNKYIHKKYAS